MPRVRLPQLLEALVWVVLLTLLLLKALRLDMLI